MSDAGERKRKPNGQFQVQHGGYRTLSKWASGKLDKRSSAAVAIRCLREAIAQDMGASDFASLGIKEQVLVEMVSAKVAVLQVMMAYALGQDGLISEHGHLRAPLSKHWLTWSESARRDLERLGIPKREKNVLDLSTYVSQRYAQPEVHDEKEESHE